MHWVCACRQTNNWKGARAQDGAPFVCEVVCRQDWTCASTCVPAHPLSGALHLPQHIAPAAVKLFSHARALPRRCPWQPRAGHCQQHRPWGGSTAGGPAVHLCLQQQDVMLHSCVGLHDGGRGRRHIHSICIAPAGHPGSCPALAGLQQSAACAGVLDRPALAAAALLSARQRLWDVRHGCRCGGEQGPGGAGLPCGCDVLHRSHVDPHTWAGCS